MHPIGTLVRFIWQNTKRAIVMVVGVVLLAGGLVMLVTPGPGLVLIVAGLAVLATEFVWAERMLDKAKAQAAAAADKVPGSGRFKDKARRLRRSRSGGDAPVAADASNPESTSEDGSATPGA